MENVVHGLGHVIFRELFARKIGEMRPLAQELDERGAIVKTGNADQIGDMVAVKSKGCGRQDEILASFFHLMGGKRYRLWAVDLFFRNEFEIMRRNIQNAAWRAVSDRDG